MTGASKPGISRAALACLLVAIVTLSSLTVPVMAGEDAPGDGPEPQTVDPRAHPLFRSLPTPPESIRLWAQLSGSGDAFFTLQRDQLPGPFTAAPLQSSPQVSFQLFTHLQTTREGGQLYYRGDDVRASWDTGFLEHVPLRGSFLVSTSTRDTEAAGPVAPMTFTARLKAEDVTGFGRTLAVDARVVEPGTSTRPVEVPFDFGPVTEQVFEGDRLLLELSWGWVQAPVVGTLRQPVVSVHAGSWLDVPLKEPVRVLEMEDRVVADNVYVQARVGHLFTREYLSLRGTQLVVNGPGLQITGGRALITAGGVDPDGPHNLTFDWRVPIEGRTLRAADYDLYVTLSQAGEDGPRVVAHRAMSVDAAIPLAELPNATLALVGSLFAACAGAAFVVWRRTRAD